MLQIRNIFPPPPPSWEPDPLKHLTVVMWGPMRQGPKSNTGSQTVVLETSLTEACRTHFCALEAETGRTSPWNISDTGVVVRQISRQGVTWWISLRQASEVFHVWNYWEACYSQKNEILCPHHHQHRDNVTACQWLSMCEGYLSKVTGCNFRSFYCCQCHCPGHARHYLRKLACSILCTVPEK